MSSSQELEGEDREVFELMYPWLANHHVGGNDTTESANSETRRHSNVAIPVSDLLDKLLPGFREEKKKLDTCCLCLEDLEEVAKITKGLGCPCKATFYHTTCFESYLNSCDKVARCPCCRALWSEDLVIID